MANLKFKRYLIDEEFDPETAERNTLHFVIVKQEPLVVNIFDVDSKGNVALVTGENIDAILDSKLPRSEFNQFLNTMIVPYTKNEVDAKLGLKLDKPTTTSSTTTNYPFVVLVDANNNSTKYQASDLGKNVANSALTSVTGAKLTLGADWEINVGTGFYFGLKGLLDKSTDTTWNRLLMADSSGRVAYTNGKNLIKGMPTLLTEAEKTTWKTEMNGGWTTASMSVGLVSPPVVDKNMNENTWVFLKGANLNLNPVNFAIDILDSTGENVIVTIPNSQVQLQPVSTDLIFYYNFSTLPVGGYKIRLNNGVAVYVVPLELTVTTGVNRININSLTWQTLAYDQVNVNNYINGAGNSVIYSSSPNNKAYAAGTEDMVVSAKSSEIFPQGSNFFLKFIGNFGIITGPAYGSGSFKVHFGLMGSDIVPTLSNATNCKAITVFNKSQTGYTHTVTNDIASRVFSKTNTPTGTFNFTIVRRGSVYLSILEYEGNVNYYAHTGSLEGSSIALVASNTTVNSTASITITEAYTF